VYQGRALVLVLNRSEKPSPSSLFFFFPSHSLTPEVKVTLEPYATQKQFKHKSLSEVDHVTGNGSVLLWSFCTAANLSYRSGSASVALSPETHN